MFQIHDFKLQALSVKALLIKIDLFIKEYIGVKIQHQKVNVEVGMKQISTVVEGGIVGCKHL